MHGAVAAAIVGPLQSPGETS